METLNKIGPVLVGCGRMGTTLAGLAVLLREENGLSKLLFETTKAARNRSIELGVIS